MKNPVKKQRVLGRVSFYFGFMENKKNKGNKIFDFIKLTDLEKLSLNIPNK